MVTICHTPQEMTPSTEVLRPSGVDTASVTFRSVDSMVAGWGSPTAVNVAANPSSDYVRPTSRSGMTASPSEVLLPRVIVVPSITMIAPSKPEKKTGSSSGRSFEVM